MLFLVLLITKVNAQDNLDALIDNAINNNNGLKAKYNKYLADLQKVPQVGSLPDLDVSVGVFVKKMELMNGDQRAQIQAMQMFPWFGTLKAAKDEASTMALSSLELFNAEKDELIYKIKSSYYQLFFTNKQIQVYDSTFFLLKSIEELLLSKTKTINTGSSSPTSTNSQTLSESSNSNGSSMSMKGGSKPAKSSVMNTMGSQPMSGSSSAFADLLRLQIEMKELENTISALKNRILMLTIQINSLLCRNADIVIPIPDVLKNSNFDYQSLTLFDSIKAKNPMMNMNRTDALAFHQRQIMNKKMSYPMIGIGVNYMLIDKNPMNTSPMNGTDMIMPMFSIKVPLYRKKYNATVKEAELLENSATEQVSNIEKILYIEFSEYKFALNDAERKLKLYDDIISLTKNSFDLLLTQYSSSGADFESLIRLQRQLLDYKINIYQAQVDKQTAIAGLQKLVSKN